MTSDSLEPPAEVPLGGGVGDAHGAEGIEIDVVVAPQLDVLEPAAAGEDVEGDVQDMVGFVIGEMALEEMEVGVDGGDQAGAARQQEHGADAAGGEALDALAQFVVDVGGGDHGDYRVRGRADSRCGRGSSAGVAAGALGRVPGTSCGVASWDLLRDNNHHSKPSVAWKNADLLPPALSQELRGFSSFFGDSDLGGLYITLGLGLGLALTECSRLDEAITAFKGAIRLNPDVADAHLRLGLLLSQQGKIDEAVSVFRDAIRRRPDDARLHIGLGAALYQSAIPRSRSPNTARRSASDPTSPRDRRGSARALMAHGETKEAIAAYRKAIELEPDLEHSQYELGLALMLQGQLDEAFVAFHEEIRIRPNQFEGLADFGQVFAQLRQLDEAIRASARPSGSSPNSPSSTLCWGMSFRPKAVPAMPSRNFAKRSGSSPTSCWPTITSAPPCSEKETGRVPSHRFGKLGCLPARTTGSPRGPTRHSRPYSGWRLWLPDCRPYSRVKTDRPMPPRQPISASSRPCRLGTLRRRGSMLKRSRPIRTWPVTSRPPTATTQLVPPPWPAAVKTRTIRPPTRAVVPSSVVKPSSVSGLICPCGSAQLESGKPEARAEVSQKLNHWRADRDLAGVRDPEVLAKLPGEERKAWTDFWADVDSLVKKAQGDRT